MFYWLRMNAEFKDFIIKCNICSSHKLAQPREPLIPHKIPSRPWQKVHADLFLFDQRHYLITVDYYSSFFEVDKLDTTDSRTVIEKLKIKCSLAALEFWRFLTMDRNMVPQSLQSLQVNSTFSLLLPLHAIRIVLKICENIVRMAVHGNFDPYLGLIGYRNTPTENGLSLRKGCSEGEHAIFYPCQVNN